MNLWQNIQRRFVITTAASQLLNGILQRQNMPDALLNDASRKESIRLASGFAWALWQELSKDKRW